VKKYEMIDVSYMIWNFDNDLLATIEYFE